MTPQWKRICSSSIARHVAIALAVTALACSRGDAGDVGDAGTPGAEPLAKAAAALRTQSANRDPCSWISRADAERILGAQLAYAPARVVGGDQLDSASDGSACLYELPHDEGLRKLVSMEISVDDPGALQSAFSMLGSVDKRLTSNEADGDSLVRGRWDFVSGVPGGMVSARRGRLSATFVASGDLIARALALADTIVSRIPDLPFVVEAGDAEVAPSGRDACALLTREEAEKVLGPLTAAPFRSRESSALALGDGPSCTYVTANHRALVITPTWQDGAIQFRMMAGLHNTLQQALGTSAAPDTLDGPWDQLSIGMDGSIYALDGDEMLQVQYKSSPVPLARVIPLVRAAVGRM